MDAYDADASSGESEGLRNQKFQVSDGSSQYNAWRGHYEKLWDDKLYLETLFEPTSEESSQEPKFQEQYEPHLSRQSTNDVLAAESGSSKHTCRPPDENHALNGYPRQNNDTFDEQHVKLRTGPAPRLEEIGIALKAGKLPKSLFRVQDTPKNIIKIGALRDDIDFFGWDHKNGGSFRGDHHNTGGCLPNGGEGMYHFHVVADDYPVRAEGVISREIVKKENLEEIAITKPLNDQAMIAGGRHDRGKLGNYFSGVYNPPCHGIIDRIHDSCQNRAYEPSDGSSVQHQCEPYNPRCHERDDTQKLNYGDGSQNGPTPRDGSGGNSNHIHGLPQS